MTVDGKSARRSGALAAVTGGLRRAARWFVARFRPKPRAPAPGEGERSGRSESPSLRPGSIEDAGLEPAEVDADVWSADAGLAALSKTLSHPDPSVRASALAVVAEFSEQQATLLISRALRDPEPRVRRAAASAAVRVGTSGVLAALIVALEDTSASVRREAARTIERLTGEAVELSSPGELPSAGQLAALKSAWKRRRLAELSED